MPRQHSMMVALLSVAGCASKSTEPVTYDQCRARCTELSSQCKTAPPNPTACAAYCDDAFGKTKAVCTGVTESLRCVMSETKCDALQACPSMSCKTVTSTAVDAGGTAPDTTSPISPDAQVTADSGAPTDTAPETAGPETTPVDAAIDSGKTPLLDFGAPCTKNTDCQANTCVAEPAPAYCSGSCPPDGCPDGFACKSVTSSGPDAAFLCIRKP